MKITDKATKWIWKSKYWYCKKHETNDKRTWN